MNNDARERQAARLGASPAAPFVPGTSGRCRLSDLQKEPAKFIDARVALGVLAVVVALVFAQLAWVLWTSHQHYGAGIRLVTEAAAKGGDPNAMARRIFLLASGEQITTFKAAAFGVSALLALIGGVFILNGATAAYNLGLAGQPEPGGLSATLQTTSPGLVIVTLAMALAAFAVSNKSSLQDQTDWDLHGDRPTQAGGTPVSTASAKPPGEQIQDLIDELETHQTPDGSAKVSPSASDRVPPVPSANQP